MKVIYKYELGLQTEQVIMLPDGAKIMHTEFQNDVLCVWAIVNPSVHTLVAYTFYVFTTGYHFPDAIADYGKYVGTASNRDGFVAHVFTFNV